MLEVLLYPLKTWNRKGRWTFVCDAEKCDCQTVSGALGPRFAKKYLGPELVIPRRWGIAPFCIQFVHGAVFEVLLTEIMFLERDITPML